MLERKPPGVSTDARTKGYAYRRGEHRLVVLEPAPTDAEIRAVNRGEIEIAFYVEQPVIMFLYRLEGRDWEAAPFSIHRIDAGDRKLPPELVHRRRDAIKRSGSPCVP